MTPEFVVEFAKEAILMTIYLSMPMLGLGLLAGLIISVFQAVTQIQEMTLTFVPKIIFTGAAIIFLIPWMIEKMIAITLKLFSILSTVV